MCGIAGILGCDAQLAAEIAPRMLRAMSHRGPDDQGTQTLVDAAKPQRPIVLLHRRLSVLDLSPAGHQPMPDRPGDESIPPNWITYNGEIYNFLELHEELSRAGWPCRTRCDTEVILHAYRVWGSDCVQRLNGMFAWCLLDTTRGTAWFCRDRLGIKPLYLFRPDSGGLLFASEVRTLLAAGEKLVRPVLSRAALESFLAQGAVHGEESIIRGVRQLSAGESLVTDFEGKPILRRSYWNIPVPDRSTDQDRRQVVGLLHQRLRDAVRLQLIADVPLGLFLSGGIDSSSLTALAGEMVTARVRTICIGFDESEFDESAAAAELAAQLGTEHQTVRLGAAEVLNDLPQVLSALDQPTVDGFNTWFVARATRRAGLTVALSGLGGDELFGGYASFGDVPRALKWTGLLAHFDGAAGLITATLRGWRSRAGGKAAELLSRRGSAVRMYLLRRELFLPAERRALHALPDGCDATCGLPRELIAAFEAATEDMDLINQVSRLELMSYMRQMLLRDVDIFSMAHALEVRVPLLDHRVVEDVARLPGEWKKPDPRPKPLLIDAVGARLPRAAYRQSKRGFTLPWSAWLRGPLAQRAAASARNRDVWRRLRLNPVAMETLWSRFAGGDQRVSPLQILAMMVLEDYALRQQLGSET